MQHFLCITFTVIHHHGKEITTTARVKGEVI